MAEITNEVTDTQRIDALDKFIRKAGALLIHGRREYSMRGVLGLGFWDEFRDLRKALDVLVEAGKQEEK